jgi:hypothetical protein
MLSVLRHKMIIPPINMVWQVVECAGNNEARDHHATHVHVLSESGQSEETKYDLQVPHSAAWEVVRIKTCSSALFVRGTCLSRKKKYPEEVGPERGCPSLFAFPLLRRHGCGTASCEARRGFALMTYRNW